jgi:hypothetical protein
MDGGLTAAPLVSSPPLYLRTAVFLSKLPGPPQTPEQKVNVDAAALKRNFSACFNGTYGCNLSILTPEQKANVDAAALKRNYSACSNGTYGCNPSVLPEVVLVFWTRKGAFLR